MADINELIQPRTGLVAKGQYQEVILAYVEKNASDVLVEKIKASHKTMDQCMRFITNQAQKKAVDGCAMIEDKEVFGWAMHFFEEDSIETVGIQTYHPQKVETPKPERKEPVKRESQKTEQLAGQMNIFDFLGGAE